MLRAIDDVLEANADNPRVRQMHGYFTTAIDGLLRGAREATECGDSVEAAQMRDEAKRYDAWAAIMITTRAARAT